MIIPTGPPTSILLLDHVKRRPKRWRPPDDTSLLHGGELLFGSRELHGVKVTRFSIHQRTWIVRRWWRISWQGLEAVNPSVLSTGCVGFHSLFSKLNISPYKGGRRKHLHRKLSVDRIHLMPLCLLQYVWCDTSNQPQSDSILSLPWKEQ